MDPLKQSPIGSKSLLCNARFGRGYNASTPVSLTDATLQARQ
jgi:hypothetical protein